MTYTALFLGAAIGVMLGYLIVTLTVRFARGLPDWLVLSIVAIALAVAWLSWILTR